MTENERPINRHTGQPIDESEALGAKTPDAASGPTSGAGAAFEADRPGVRTPSPPDVEQPAGENANTIPGGTSAPSQQEIAVRSALETVMDPEINLSVIDLGLIREIHFLEDPARTHIKMMLTTPFCPYAPQLMADVKQATMSVVPQECEVEILADAWSPDLMPDPGLLGFSF